LGIDPRILIIAAATAVGFLLGYSISSSTGVEPGYFDAAEAGSYGATDVSDSDEDISQADQDYYDSLTDE
jgi:hypothetical protein